MLISIVDNLFPSLKVFCNNSATNSPLGSLVAKALINESIAPPNNLGSISPVNNLSNLPFGNALNASLIAGAKILPNLI